MRWTLILLLTLSACGGSGGEGSQATAPKKTRKSTKKKRTPKGAARLYVDNHSDQTFEATLDGTAFTVAPWTMVIKRPAAGKHELSITRGGSTLLEQRFDASGGKAWIADPSKQARYHSYRIVYTKTPTFGNYDNDPRKYEKSDWHVIGSKIDFGIGESVPSMIYTKDGFAARHALRKRTPRPLPKGLVAHILAADEAKYAQLTRVYSGRSLFSAALKAGAKLRLPEASKAAFDALADPKSKRYRTALSALSAAKDPAWGKRFVVWFGDRALTQELVVPASRWLDGERLANLLVSADKRVASNLLSAVGRQPAAKRKILLVAGLKQSEIPLSSLVRLFGYRKDKIEVDAELAEAMVARVSEADTPGRHELDLLKRAVGAGPMTPSIVKAILALLANPPSKRESDVADMAAQLKGEAAIEALTGGFPDYDKKIRLRLINALHNRDRTDAYKDDVSFEKLLIAAASDPDEGIRGVAYMTLMKNGKWLAREATRPLVIKMLETPARERPRGLSISISTVVNGAELLPPEQRCDVLISLLPRAGSSTINLILSQFAALPDPLKAKATAAVRARWDKLSRTAKSSAFAFIAGKRPRKAEALKPLLIDPIGDIRVRAFGELAYIQRRSRDAKLLDELVAIADAEKDAKLQKQMKSSISHALSTRASNEKSARLKVEREKLEASYEALKDVKDPSATQRKRIYQLAATCEDRSYRARFGSLMRRALVPGDMKTIQKIFDKAPDAGKKAIISAVTGKLRQDQKAHAFYKKALADKSSVVREEIYRSGSWLTRRNEPLKKIFLAALDREKDSKLKSRYSRYIKR